MLNLETLTTPTYYSILLRKMESTSFNFLIHEKEAIYPRYINYLDVIPDEELRIHQIRDLRLKDEPLVGDYFERRIDAGVKNETIHLSASVIAPNLKEENEIKLYSERDIAMMLRIINSEW